MFAFCLLQPERQLISCVLRVDCYIVISISCVQTIPQSKVVFWPVPSTIAPVSLATVPESYFEACSPSEFPFERDFRL